MAQFQVAPVPLRQRLGVRDGGVQKSQRLQQMVQVQVSRLHGYTFELITCAAVPAPECVGEGGDGAGGRGDRSSVNCVHPLHMCIPDNSILCFKLAAK